MDAGDFVPTQFYVSKHFFVPQGVGSIQYRISLIDACREIIHRSEILLLLQIVKTLEDNDSVISDQITGIENCLKHIELNQCTFKTPSRGRSILLSPEADRRIYHKHARIEDWNTDSYGEWRGYDVYMHDALNEYILVLQQDALEFTSTYFDSGLKLQYLESDPERQVESVTAEYDGYSLRCRSWESHCGGTQIQLDYMNQITRIEPHHCYLIPTKSII
jgi:hypothetical protein